jgi:hypothetical protein
MKNRSGTYRKRREFPLEGEGKGGSIVLLKKVRLQEKI